MASISKRGKKWQARIEFKDKNGKRKTKSNTFLTKREANVWATEMQKQSFDGELNLNNSTPFPQYFEDWFYTYKEPGITERTKLTYISTLNVLKDYFKNVSIGEMNRHNYQKFMTDYGKTHSKATMNKINNQVKSCIKSAIYDDVIHKNFTDKITVSFDPTKTRRIEYLNIGEMKRLTQYLLKGLNYHYTSRPMILLAIYTGMRLGEIQALTWADINFNFKTITINKAWNETKLEFKDTKTDGSNRIIRVNKIILNMLQGLKSFRQPNSENEQIFVNQFQTVPTSDAVNKALRSALTDLEIDKKGFHFHSLRHTHVAYLLSQNIDLYLISKRLGHKDMTTTIRIYSYLIDEYKRTGDDEIEKALSKIEKTTVDEKDKKMTL